ncbi:8610_t:CDS:2, partial [Acaulospora morrowiae]
NKVITENQEITDDTVHKKSNNEDESNESGEIEAEPIDVGKNYEEIRSLTEDERNIRDKLLVVLTEQQERDTQSGKDYLSSTYLNGIIDFSDDETRKRIKKFLNKDQITWLEEKFRKKTWDPTSEYTQYINQFIEDVCDRVQIPILVRKSFVPENTFNSYRHEAHDIAQQILTHFSVRLEAPIRVESNNLNLERTYAIDTTVYILNRLFRMHQDVLDVRWIELTTPDTKKHKIDGILKVIKATEKDQVLVIVEFSFGRRAPLTKEDGDQVKLCRNSMRILNKILQGVPKDKARVYMIQTVNGHIIIKYLVRPLPSIYILQQFTRIKIPVSFDDFEQFAKDMMDLMITGFFYLQADVLSTIKAINKSITKDKHIHTTSVQDTPKKAGKENQTLPSSPKSPCPGGSPSELPSLI